MAQQVQLTATVAESQLGQRLDQALAELFPDYSRSRIKDWILDNRVQVNGDRLSPQYLLFRFVYRFAINLYPIVQDPIFYARS